MLVGREAELTVLDALVGQTAAGAGGVVLLAGEPGVGKTHLARAGAGRAAGAQVSWGACRESEGAPPLWPWLQVLRRTGGPRIAADAADGAAARFRLFERVQRVLADQAADQPQLVVIDDLHRADEASLRLLGYLSETLWPAPIGMIVTWRDTEVATSSLAAGVIAGLARAPGSRRCDLSGLSRESVAQWLAAAGLDRVDADDLHARTAGNPLFVSESIALLAGGSRLNAPLRSVGEVIRERLAPLPPACRDALEVAAVLGRDFEYPPLAAALQVSPAAAVAALDPAVSARLVSPVDSRAGAYRFVHTLIRDAVEAQLAPSRRAGLHARAFAALRDTGWGQAADLAHHAVQGRPGVSDETAASAARAAAEAADRLLAFHDAATWWQTTIDLTRRPDRLAVDLEMRLGRSLLNAGQVDQARVRFEAAAEEAARAGDAPALAAGALAVGDTVAEVAADHQLVALLDRALREPGLPPGSRVRLTARRAIATYWQPGGQDESRRASARAVHLAEQAGDTEALGAALIARQFTLRGPDFLDERLAAGRAVLDIATRLGDAELRFRAHQWLVPDRFQAGDLTGVAADVEQMAAIAQAHRSPLQRWWVLIYRGLLAGFAGRDDEAEELAHEATALGRRLGLPAADAYRVGQLSRIYWGAGRLAELDADIGQALARFPGLVTLRCVRALASATAGRHAEASGEIEALTARGFAALPRDSLYLASLAILAEAAVTCGAASAGGPLLAALAPYETRNLIQGVPVGWGAAAWYIARLQWLTGRPADAARSAATAQRLHRQWGAGSWPDPLAGLAARGGPGAPLSQRESQVIALLASGRENAEMAASLGVSVHTIERHVANIFLKLGVRNRAEATAWAHRHGRAG
ncbi:MAG TPA: AAA family ATPase [Streptosporangiaceae bacterium]|nr:AAA family ATPase [Streptosporangiaceae bacterium]